MKRLLLAAGGVTIAAGLLLGKVARADVISTSVTGPLEWDSGDFLVSASGTVTTQGNAGIDTPGPVSVGTLTNDGTIQGAPGFVNTAGASVTMIANSGNIFGSGAGLNIGIFNLGTASIGTIANTGTVTGSAAGLINAGTITTLKNLGGGTFSATTSGTGIGINNVSGSIGTLLNLGEISSSVNYGLLNSATITTLNNGGTITGTNFGISNASGATIGSFNNFGTIDNGLLNKGTISSLNNTGVISNPGGLGSAAIANNSGGTLGTITNSGSIEGSISDSSTAALTIDGGTGNTFGMLQGSNANSLGRITNSSSNLAFGSGNINLADTVNLGSFALQNSANLLVNTPIGPVTVTGNVTNAGSVSITGAELSASGTYTQSAGSTLLTHGTLEGDGGIVSNGGTIGGQGTLIGNVTVNGGSVQVGASPDTLTVNGNLSQTGGTLVFEVDSNGVGGFLSSQLDVTGTIALSDVDIVIDFKGIADPAVFFASLGDSTNAILADLFQNGIGGALDPGEILGGGDTFTASAENYTIQNFDIDNDGVVTLQEQADVPEPASIALFGAALFGLSASRRRKRTRNWVCSSVFICFRASCSPIPADCLASDSVTSVSCSSA